MSNGKREAQKEEVPVSLRTASTEHEGLQTCLTPAQLTVLHAVLNACHF